MLATRQMTLLRNDGSRSIGFGKLCKGIRPPTLGRAAQLGTHTQNDVADVVAHYPIIRADAAATPLSLQPSLIRDDLVDHWEFPKYNWIKGDHGIVVWAKSSL